MYPPSPTFVLRSSSSNSDFMLTGPTKHEHYTMRTCKPFSLLCSHYDGVRLSDGKKCVVKIASRTCFPYWLSMFDQETDVFTRAKHKHMTELLGSGLGVLMNSDTTGMLNYACQTQYMAVENPKWDLNDLLANAGPLQDPFIRSVTRKLAKTIDHLHSRDIGFLTLSSDKIMFNEEGNLKLNGIGITVSLRNVPCYSGVFIQPFSAPEVYSARYPFGFLPQNAVVYSLGINLLAMKIGKVPSIESFPYGCEEFQKETFWNTLQVLYQVSIEPSLRDLLKKMLLSNPMMRPTLTQVLNHPWLVEAGEDSSDHSGCETIAEL